jgi:hypothetical protein
VPDAGLEEVDRHIEGPPLRGEPGAVVDQPEEATAQPLAGQDGSPTLGAAVSTARSTERIGTWLVRR